LVLVSTDSMFDIQMGIYRHYKGPLYQVIGLAHDANAMDLFVSEASKFGCGQHCYLGERTVVVYMPLQLDGAHPGPRMAVRTLEDFVARVGPRKMTKRFEYLGPVLIAEMLQ